MSYLRSAQEMAEVLNAPVLLRIDPDPRFLERHDRIGRYAAETPHAGRFYFRLLETIYGRRAGVSLAGQALWVAGPWGSLEHLPWAVGLADQAARGGVRAYLAERDPHGVLRSMTPAADRQARGTVPDAVTRLGTWAPPVSADLAGVRILLTALPGETPVGASPEEGRNWTLVLSDVLPESLEGPYPDPAGIMGVVLVAGFRDHTRYELEESIKGLRDAGYRILGLIAIGPEGEVLAPEPVRRPSTFAAPLSEPVRPAESLRPAEPVRQAEPVRPAEPVGPPESIRPSEPARAAVPEPTPSIGAPPSAPAPAPVSMAPTPSPEPRSSPPPAPVSPAPSVVEVPAEIKAPPSHASVPAAFVAPPHVPDPTPAPLPPPTAPAPPTPPAPPPQEEAAVTGTGASVPLLANWRKEKTRQKRIRRLATGIGVVAAAAFTGLVLYNMFLHRLIPQSWRSSAPDTTVTRNVAGPVDSLGVTGAGGTTREPSSLSRDTTRAGFPAAGDTGAATLMNGARTRLPLADSTAGREVRATLSRFAQLESISLARWDSLNAASERSLNRYRLESRDASGALANSLAPRDSLAGPDRAGSVFSELSPDSAVMERGDSIPFQRSNSWPRAPYGSLDEESLGSRRESLFTPLGHLSRYVLEFSSFKDNRAADSVVKVLRIQGVAARTLRVTAEGEAPSYRVVMGQYAGVAEAESVAHVLLERKKVSSVSIVGDGGRGELKAVLPTRPDPTDSTRRNSVVR